MHGLQAAVKNVFIRGSVVRYVQIPKSAVDTALLEDATRRGAHLASRYSNSPLTLRISDAQNAARIAKSGR
jgi:hypothetical protein